MSPASGRWAAGALLAALCLLGGGCAARPDTIGEEYASLELYLATEDAAQAARFVDAARAVLRATDVAALEAEARRRAREALPAEDTAFVLEAERVSPRPLSGRVSTVGPNGFLSTEERPVPAGKRLVGWLRLGAEDPGVLREGRRAPGFPEHPTCVFLEAVLAWRSSAPDAGDLRLVQRVFEVLLERTAADLRRLTAEHGLAARIFVGGRELR